MSNEPANLTDDQICGGYSKRSLLGNWYEERLNKTREQPTSRIIRKVEPNFSFEHSSGVHDLDRLTRLRKPAHNIITNGQRKINYSTEMKDNINSQSFVAARVHDKRSIVKFAGESSLFTIRQPENVQINYHNRAKLLNSVNLPALMMIPQTERQPAASSNSYVSTYQQNYDQPAHTAEEHHQRRTPLPPPQHDLMNSLPLGKGEWNLKPNVHIQGYFRHIRSQITNNPNLSQVYK